MIKDKNKIGIFDSNLIVFQENGDIELKENMTINGQVHQAKLNVETDTDVIVIKKLEKKLPKYLKCKCCADFIVLEKSESQCCNVHIFEFKTTIKPLSTSKFWDSISEQFNGALINAIMICNFLEIKISKICLYTCYRNKPDYSQSVELRLHSHDPSLSKIPTKLIIENFTKFELNHSVIQVDSDFSATTKL